MTQVGAHVIRHHVDAPFDHLGRLTVLVMTLPLAFVVVLDGPGAYRTAQPGWQAPKLDDEQTAAGLQLSRTLAEAGAVVIVTDVETDARTKGNPWLPAMGIRAIASHPLAAPDGTALGALFVADAAPRAWTARDLETLAALAETAASKATLRGAVRRSAETAALLQHSMLTDLPAVAHVELLARYLPAQDTAQIGGDWYDAFVLPDGVTALVVGDVAGHDMPAAAKMGQLRNLLRGIAWQSNGAPQDVLSALDRTVYGLAVAELATVIYARLEPAGSAGWRLRWANAGHPAPLLVTADGAACYLEKPSGVLLAFGDAEHVDGIESLPAGSTLLLYTDGLIESRTRDIDQGLERLRAAAVTARGWPLELLCDHVLGELTGGGNEDDVTLLAVRMP